MLSHRIWGVQDQIDDRHGSEQRHRAVRPPPRIPHAVTADSRAIADWTRSGRNAIVRRRAKRVDFRKLFRRVVVVRSQRLVPKRCVNRPTE
jgi:hypothetical protein